MIIKEIGTPRGITVDSGTTSCQIDRFLFQPGEDFEQNLLFSYNKSIVNKPSDFIYYYYYLFLWYECTDKN